MLSLLKSLTKMYTRFCTHLHNTPHNKINEMAPSNCPYIFPIILKSMAAIFGGKLETRSKSSAD